MSDIEAVLPVPRTVTIKGAPFEVRQIKVRQLAKVIRLLTPLAHLFKVKGKLDIPTLVMTYTPEVIGLMAAMTEQTEEWVGDLDIDELVLLASEVLEVNVDFFIQKVLPSVSQVTEKLQSSTKTVQALGGLTPSKS